MIPITRISCAATFFLLLAASAGATLVPGSERNVTEPVPDVAAFDQGGGQLATDGDAFLAVWVDRTLAGVGDIHGARVSSEGKRIDDDALHIAITDEDENRVAVAYGGNRYLTVWSTPDALRARFVANEAVMSEVFDLAEVSGLTQPQIAFNGQTFLVVWTAGPVFRGALVGTNGQLLKTFDVASTAQTFSETDLVALNGAFHFVTAITDFNGVPNGNGYPSDVGMTAIDANGVVAARTVVAPATTPVFDLRAAASTTEILIAWSTAREIPGGTVRSVRVTAAGPGAVDSQPADGMYLQEATASGNEFLLIYGTAGPKLAYFPGLNTPIFFLPIHIAESLVIDSASNGLRTLLLVRGLPRLGFEHGPAGGDVYVVRTDSAGSSLEPLSVAPRHQSSPDIAAAGNLRLAAWCEYVGSDRRLSVVASRLDAAGNALDINGIDLGAYAIHPTAPRVASNGTDWLVVWVEGTNLYGSRIARNGERLDAFPFLIALHVFENSDLAVSFDGTQYVIVYFRGQFLRGLRTTVRATLLTTAQGTLFAEEITLSAEGANEFPAIGSGPDGSLIVWRSGSYLNGMLLSDTLTPLAFPSIYPAGPRPAIAWNHGTYLVAAPFRGPFGDEIQWQLVSNTGVVQTPLSTFLDIEATLVAGSGNPSLELEAHDDGFLLFWNGVASDALQRDANIYAARIGANGILAEGPKFIASTLVDTTPSIGASGNTIVYSRKIGHATRETARVYAREVHDVSGNPRRRAVH